MKWNLVGAVAMLGIGWAFNWTPWITALCVLFLIIDPEARWNELLGALKSHKENHA